MDSALSSAPLVLQAHAYRCNGFRDQRAILVRRFAFHEAHATPVLEDARVGHKARAAAAADERDAHVDGNDSDRLRMQRARRRAHGHVEQRHDRAAVHGAEAVGHLRLDGQRQACAALTERVGLNLEVLEKRDLLLVLAREVDVHTMVAPPSTAIAWPVMWRDASEASSTASPFRSSSPPSRRVGVHSWISFPAVSSVARVILEGKKPGQIAFTVMPCTPHSAASWRVRPTTPCLVAV